MAEVVIRQRAVADLDAIFDYLNARNPSAARSYLETLRLACLSLADFPNKAPLYDDRFRALIVRNHAVFYTHDPISDRVFVVRILDMRRDVAALLRSTSDPSLY